MPYINTHNRNIRISRANKAILDRGEKYGQNNLTPTEKEIYDELKRKENSFNNPINKTFYVIRVNGSWKLLDENNQSMGYSPSSKPTLVGIIQRKYNDRIILVSRGAYNPNDGNYKVEVI